MSLSTLLVFCVRAHPCWVPDLISHLLGPVADPWYQRERQSSYEQMTVLESYIGPHLSFPLRVEHTNALLSAFKDQQVLSRHLDPGS